MCPDRTPLASQISRPFSLSTQTRSSFNSDRENWVLPPRSGPSTSTASPWVRRSWWDGKPRAAEAQCLIPFPTPSSLGLPNRLLSLATGSRSLPACCCGIHPLRGFPQGPFPKGCKLRNWRGSYHSLDPSQAKGPQEGSQARAQLAGPRAGMTDAGILSGHLGPMNPPGEEQDEKDRPQLEPRPGLSL